MFKRRRRVARLAVVAMLVNGEWKYGLDIVQIAGLSSYRGLRALQELEDWGAIESRWDLGKVIGIDTPRRRYYRLNPNLIGCDSNYAI